jgi:hypothetical protein
MTMRLGFTAGPRLLLLGVVLNSYRRWKDKSDFRRSRLAGHPSASGIVHASMCTAQVVAARERTCLVTCLKC